MLDTLTPPFSIPSLRIVPTHQQIFMFSAVTWNRHHVHYSKEAAQREGLPDVVAQRALLGNFFVRLLTEWLGGAGEVRRLSWRVVSSAVPGQAIECSGTVVDRSATDEGNFLECEMSIQDEAGRVVAVGRATVVMQQAERQ